MNETRVVELAAQIAEEAEQLKHDVGKPGTEHPPYGEIHAIRRSLVLLETELRDSHDEARGDAC